ncbi:hypothetical protein KIPE111705_22230 [Kibdelosporangium persicum]
MGGPDLVQQNREAIEQAKHGIIDFIIQNGGQVLLDVIGYTDAKKCFGEGDVAACLWTVVNVGSLLVLIAKLPAVSSAIAKIVAGLTKFLESSAAGRRILDLGRTIMAEARVACVPGRSSAPQAQAPSADGSQAVVQNTAACPRFTVDSNGEIIDILTPAGKIELPKNLDGGTATEVGEKIWAHGPKLAAELIGKRSPEELRRIASKRDAERLQDFYSWVEKNMPRNPTAPSRVKLCQEIIDAWS